MKLTQILLAEYDEANQPWHHAFVIIPHHPAYNQIARLVIEEEGGPVLILSCVPQLGQYELTEALEPRSYDEPVSLTIDGRCMEPKSLEDLLGSGHPLIALELIPGSDRFQVSGVALVDEDPRLRNNERLRSCVKEANSQLQNGLKYQVAPSIVLVYQDSIFVPDHEIVLAALYGDLTYSFPQRRPHEGRLSFGRNGVFRPNKNRSVSALSLIRNNTCPCTVHNHWARLLLLAGLLGGKEAIRRDDGRFEIAEFPA